MISKRISGFIALSLVCSMLTACSSKAEAVEPVDTTIKIIEESTIEGVPEPEVAVATPMWSTKDKAMAYATVPIEPMGRVSDPIQVLKTFECDLTGDGITELIFTTDDLIHCSTKDADNNITYFNYACVDNYMYTNLGKYMPELKYSEDDSTLPDCEIVSHNGKGYVPAICYGAEGIMYTQVYELEVTENNEFTATPVAEWHVSPAGNYALLYNPDENTPYTTGSIHLIQGYLDILGISVIA